MIRRIFTLSFALVCAAALLPGSVSAQKKETGATRAELHTDVMNAIDRYKKADPSIDKFFKDSVGYVVFPRIGKAGFIVGGGAGDGEVFEKGKIVGAASVGFGTVGLTAGIQEYSEIVFFKDQAALDRFKQNKFEFAANASVVVVKLGAAKAAEYRNGVAVFTHSTGGAMVDASIGTQKFTYKADR